MTGSRPSRSMFLTLEQTPLLQCLDNRRIRKRRRISRISLMDDRFEHTPHDLSRARLREGIHELDVIRFCDRSEFLAHVRTESFCKLITLLQFVLEHYEDIDRLTFDLMLNADRCSFRDSRVTYECAFNFCGPDTVTGNFEHVIESSHDPEIPIFIALASIPAQIHIFKFSEVRLFIPFGISPHRAEHPRPGLADDDVAAFIGRSF